MKFNKGKCKEFELRQINVKNSFSIHTCWVTLTTKFITNLLKKYFRKTQLHIFKKALTFLSCNGKSISLVLCVASIYVSEITNTKVFKRFWENEIFS